MKMTKDEKKILNYLQRHKMMGRGQDHYNIVKHALQDINQSFENRARASKALQSLKRRGLIWYGNGTWIAFDGKW